MTTDDLETFDPFAQPALPVRYGDCGTSTRSLFAKRDARRGRNIV